MTFGHQYRDVEKNPIYPNLYKFSFGYLNKKNGYATADFRLLYKNRFDLLDGIIKNGSVELLDFGVRSNKNNSSLEYFTLLHLESMPLSSKFFSEPTKELTLGFKRLFYDDKLYKYGEYGVGKRIRVNDGLSYAFGIYGGIYDSDITLFSLGIKSEAEYKVVSKYLFRVGANISRFEDKEFTSSLDETKLFSQIHYKTSKNSLIGTKVEYFDNQDKYYVSSLYYNYSF